VEQLEKLLRPWCRYTSNLGRRRETGTASREDTRLGNILKVFSLIIMWSLPKNSIQDRLKWKRCSRTGGSN
jgi:hypothetical protein